MIPSGTDRMAIKIGRRDFVAGVGGAAVVWPLAARTQQPSVPVIGALHAASREGTTPFMAAYREGLRTEGYVEGQNVAIEYRWADGVFDRLPTMMADLVRLRPDVITAFGRAAEAAHDARAAGMAGTIPIVLSIGTDPVASGYISSMNRPDNNITGVTSLALVLAAKRVEFLSKLVRTDSKLGLLENPSVRETERREIENAARAIGWQLLVVRASNAAEFDTAFATLAHERVGALIIATDTFFYSEMKRLASLAAQHALPAIGPIRDFPAAGGLMSYSTSIPDTYRQVGVYTGKVLKGIKPADLPFFHPTRFELVINLTAAKALGLTVPQTVLVTADEVIE
jgi:putative tryptophan/tyrosine transport system substrate-binding protein